MDRQASGYHEQFPGLAIKVNGILDAPLMCLLAEIEQRHRYRRNLEATFSWQETDS